MTTATGTTRARNRAAALVTVLVTAGAGAALLLPAESSADPHPPTAATRTWVSGVGDDVNPCSRTAPCKTFAGAISKTSEGGEINVLDPGGYGGVTITKALTISAEGVEGGVLVSGQNGIVVNAGADDDVVLRGLDIEGLGTGLDGIKFIAGGSLHVEDTTINNFSGSGINFFPTTPASLVVDHVSVTETFTGTGVGIWVHSNGGTTTGVVDDSSIATSTFGIKVEAGGTVTVRGTTIDSCASGVWASTSTSKAEVNLVDSTVTGCSVYALRSQGDTAVLTLDGVHVSGNALGIKTFGAAKVISYGNNVNRDGGAPTQTAGMQ